MTWLDIPQLRRASPIYISGSGTSAPLELFDLRAEGWIVGAFMVAVRFEVC